MTKEELKNYEPKGDLEGFPKEIIARMLECQEEQGNPRNVTIFEKQCDAAKQCNKGFEWDDTKEGWDFWHDVITNKNFNLFFERYPKQDNQYNSQEFNLENYTPKGQLTGFPKEIIAKMLDYQEKQGYPRDVSVFEKNRTAGEIPKGFVWWDAEEGYGFWDEVIGYENFALFFTRYPKKEEDSQEFNNNINYKQHKYCRKMPLSLNSVETDIDTLIDILQQLKQNKDYNDIRVFNIDKLKFLEFNINEDEDDEAFFKIINDIEGQVIREIEPSTQKYKYSCYLRNNSCARSICLGVDLDKHQLINIIITLTH